MYAAAAARGRVSRPRLIALQPARNTLPAEWIASRYKRGARRNRVSVDSVCRKRTEAADGAGA